MGDNDIAIIGMSCRVAGADSPSKLWDLLVSSRDVQQEIARFNINGYYKSSGGSQKGVTNVKHAYFMDEDVDKFDNEFFSIPPIEAAAMDPQQRILLEIAYEAIENAGIRLEALQGTDTAVYTGLFTSDYATSLLRDIDATPKYHSTGCSNSIAANRLSYFFDLHGPSMVIDTACSSTMVALHQAVAGLQTREAGMAIVCGANLILNPDMFVHMSELGFLSPSGKCQSFDAAGDGYARGEGALALLLKPLGAALRDNDPIRSVIRGARINQDGRTNGITMPSSLAQKRNMQVLYESYGLRPADVQYVEAHGTGTAVGDPIELSAIESVFCHPDRQENLVVGSVKPNVGHLEACAALIGIIKAVESLERGLIPPQLHYSTPNPKINLDTIAIPTSTRSWPRTRNGVRCAAVNSFGFGGTNGHLVLESFPTVPSEQVSQLRHFLFKISAANEISLAALAESYADYIDRQRPSLSDLAYTLLARRSTMKRVMFLTASSHDELIEKLRNWNGTAKVMTWRPSLEPRIGFVFTGQGAQWAGMGSRLLATSKLFASVVDQCDGYLAALPDKPAWSIREELAKPREDSRINLSAFSQPICTALQLGLVELWKSWGVRPQAVVGHSSGEIGAAYAAGLLSLQHAIIVAYYRGLHMGSSSSVLRSGPKGAMCAIGIAEEECQQILYSYKSRVALAAVNSPTSCTLSGDKDAIQEIVEHCKEKGIFCRALQVDTAYHSHHMLPVAPLYEKSLINAGVCHSGESASHNCEMFSSVIGSKLSSRKCTPEYWKQNMVSTVRFSTAVTEAMQAHDLDVLVELGPHPALERPAVDTVTALGKESVRYLSSCVRNKDDFVSMLGTVGEMINANIRLKCESINSVEDFDGVNTKFASSKVLTDLPRYQWDHRISHWAETRVSRNTRHRAFPRHQLLGARSSNDTSLNASWRNILLLKEIDWLKDMMAAGTVVLNPCAFLLMAIEAARQVQITNEIDESLIRLTGIQFLEELSLSALEEESGSIETNLTLHLEERTKFRFFIFANDSRRGSSWQKLCVGNIHFTSERSLAMSHRGVVHDHDEALMAYIDSFGAFSEVGLDQLQVNGNSASGRFMSTSDCVDYLLAPSLFAPLLQVPKMLLLGHGLPALYRHEAIDCLDVPTAGSIRNGGFDICLTQHEGTRGSSDLVVRDLDEGNRFIGIYGLRSRLVRQVQRKAPLDSLFFQPRVHPDISFLHRSSPLSMSHVIELVTHKWPMCDIGIMSVASGVEETIFQHLSGIRDHERPRFRSLHLISERDSHISNKRVRKVERFGADQKFHFVVTGAQMLPSSSAHLHVNGLACVPIENEDTRALFEDAFDFVAEIPDLGGPSWLLGRVRDMQNGLPEPRKVRLVECDGWQLPSSPRFDVFESIRLDRENSNTVSILFQQDNESERSDLIVLDCGKESMLTTWSGSELLPWMQSVVDRVDNFLWVSNQTDESPFTGVAGSFVRTIQSEHPSMKAASLLFKDNNDPDFFARAISDVYDRMVHGSCEVEIIAQNRQIHVLRYQPDDELSASVGVAPPRWSSTASVSSCSYEVSLASSREVALLCDRSDRFVTSDNDVQVNIETSVVDCDDVVYFGDASVHHHSPGSLGQFFAGVIISGAGCDQRSNTEVVGWGAGAHSSSLHLPEANTFPKPENMAPAEAAMRFAALSAAFAVVDGSARARPGETVKILVSGVLADALTKVCNYLGVCPKFDPDSNGEFTVTFDPTTGLSVNGNRVSVQDYMRSGRFREYVHKFFTEEFALRTTASALPLWKLQNAFENACLEPISTVLEHTGLEQAQKYCMVYRKAARLFQEDAAYIIVGGLGGLGKYLCQWMIANGARHLVVLSRSGLTSEEARSAVERLQKLGAELSVFRCDATNRAAVDEALDAIRKQRPIRGCLNMVLVLEDSPLLTMKPAQWDRALRTKVDSTWNLHEATLRDNLDHFIMFSSVSSISGNRTQSNYATGNAFLNSMAQYRRSRGLPGVAVALGAMSGIGVVAEDHDLLRTLNQCGLRILGPDDFEKIMEAAIFESRHPDRSLLSVGFKMFETLDGVVQSSPEENQLFWTESAEFGFLLDHQMSASGPAKSISLLEQLRSQSDEVARDSLLQGFLLCLSSVLGYEAASLDPASSLASYGLDSLNAVSCRYWFFKQLEINVPVFDILGCRSINELVARVLQRLKDNSVSDSATTIPRPVHHRKESLDIRPLSHSQSRLWFLQRLLTDKTVYNLMLVCHISGGPVNVPLFLQAWSIFVARHEVLHSKLVDTPKGLQQIPTAHPMFQLVEIEASEEDAASQIEAVTHQARSYVFDLEAGELIKGWLLKLHSGWRFFLASHHLAWDRGSLPTIFEETSAIYQSLEKGDAPEAALKPVPYQFIDYALWQKDCLSNKELVDPHVNYWQTQLAGIPDSVSLLPTAIRPARPTLKQYLGGSTSLRLDSNLASGMKAFCKSNAITPFMFMASTVNALVYRLTGDDDIVVGIPDGDRGHTEFDRLVGFTVNMLAIRSKISKGMAYGSFLEEYRKTCLSAYEHRAIPFDYLLQQLEVPRRTSHSPVFQITVNYQVQGAFRDCDFGGFKFDKYDHYNVRALTDFGLEVEETADGQLHCVFDYDASLYNEAAMVSLAKTFKVFAESIIATKGSARLDKINLVPAEDLAVLSSALQPDFSSKYSFERLDNELFPTLFARSAAAHPNKAALIDDNRILTYSELDIATNRVANSLLGSGVQNGDRVGVCCEPGVDMIIAIYGIIRAGCVYVPIDPDSPAERILSMVEDVELGIVLVGHVNPKVHERFLICGIQPSRMQRINIIATSFEDAGPPKLARNVVPSDSFCCIFTSGSTGRPKGIYIGHKQLRYQMEGYHQFCATRSEDHLLLSSAIVFDMSLATIFGTILHGATMIIADREARYSPVKMVDLLVEQRVSNCIFTPTQFKMLLTAPNKSRLSEWTSLRSIVLGGEQIPPWVVREFHNLKLPHASIFNGYAPSETTVVNSLRKLLPEDADCPDIPLAGPIFPARFHILNGDLDPVPIGQTGELFIGGPVVTSGYVNREELTAASFLRDPFASIAEIENGDGRLYRTGDSFRLLQDGTIQAVGRIGGDRQVKIRGMRTELNEIENVIYEASQDVDDAESCPILLVAVVYYQTGSLDGILAAYLITNHQGAQNIEQQRSLKAYIQLRLRALLPVHMVPSEFVFLSTVPRTVSGKIDYKTMLTWDPPAPETVAISGGSGVQRQMSETQSIIASIWKEVLGLDADLSYVDDFFALGGHSLILVNVQKAIQEQFDVTVNLSDMFAAPTISGMESLILAQPEDDETTKPLVNGTNVVNGIQDHNRSLASTATTTDVLVDWEKEGSLPENFDFYVDAINHRPVSAVAVTGACTMIGAHFIHHALQSTRLDLHCIAVEAADENGARLSVMRNLEHWHLLSDLSSDDLTRLIVYKGSLSHPTLGLSPMQIASLDKGVHAIYQLDSEVSLLKRYDNLRASNVGSLQFLISLAHGQVNNTKAIHFLSTWGVPHLQAWHKTVLKDNEWLVGEVEMTNMKPDTDPTLGYLKARWACESMLYQTASRGIPVTIFRSCMCASSPRSGTPLNRTDINRRILEGSLQTGLVPDFSSVRGGGMSWITADFLVESMLFLSQNGPKSAGRASIYHLSSDVHVPYTKLGLLLDRGHDGQKLQTCEPSDWFQALRASGNPEMAMQAEVLERWCEAGWVPFSLEATETLALLRTARGIVPPKMDRESLLKLVVGEQGF